MIGRVLPIPDACSVPVAKKIRSCWRVGDAPVDDPLSKELDVELMLAGHFHGSSSKGEAFLAVRVLACQSSTCVGPTQTAGKPDQAVLCAGSTSITGSGSSGSGRSGTCISTEDEDPAGGAMGGPGEGAESTRDAVNQEVWAAILDDFHDVVNWDVALQVSRPAKHVVDGGSSINRWTSANPSGCSSRARRAILPDTLGTTCTRGRLQL